MAGSSEEEKREDEAEETVNHVVQEVAAGMGEGDDAKEPANKKRRLCRYPGCNKVIKSQGHCQRHGARAKRCKVEGCDKQAQGTHDGMCKRHWKAANFPVPPPPKEDLPPPPEGESVYDIILPQSISYRPNSGKNKPKEEGDNAVEPPPTGDGVCMPLVTFLREGLGKEAGWHRNSERRARGVFTVTSLSSQLEPWERQLALVEILLLSGGTPYANFKDLAHAWGREKGFHHLLASSVFERRGEVERKKRSDAGKILSDEQKQAFKDKLKRSRASKGESGDEEAPLNEEEGEEDAPEEPVAAAGRASVSV